MKRISPVTKWLLVFQWDRWHQAQPVNSSPATSEAPRQQVSLTGTDGFGGLIAHGIPFYYDAHLGRWLCYGKTVVSE